MRLMSLGPIAASTTAAAAPAPAVTTFAVSPRGLITCDYSSISRICRRWLRPFGSRLTRLLTFSARLLLLLAIARRSRFAGLARRTRLRGAATLLLTLSAF